MAKTTSENSIKLQGHEKFPLREGWLAKGVALARENPRGFFGDNGPDLLGIGSNMVKSLRYWMKAGGLSTDSGGKVELTELGELIADFDPYFEDLFSLWLLHSNLAKNKTGATTWFLFFNRCNAQELSREQISEILRRELEAFYHQAFSVNSLKNDIDVLLAMYSRKKEMSDPEDKSMSPLARLGVLSQNGRLYSRLPADKRKIHKFLVLYELLQAFCENGSETGISIDHLLSGEASVGRIYHMGAILLNDFLDILDSEGFIRVDRTAGLDMVYLKTTIAPWDALKAYYQNR